MKKLLIVIAALAVSVGANAQIKFGAKAGLNLSQISASDQDGAEATSMLPGFFVSGHANFGLGQFFGVQPELMFSMQGGKEEDMSMHLNYINIPVLFEVKPIANFSIFVGPQIGFNLYKSASAGGVTISGSQFEEMIAKVNTIDFAAVVGVQYAVLDHFLISARYNIGFTPTLDIDGVGGMTNRVIQIGVGYQF